MTIPSIFLWTTTPSIRYDYHRLLIKTCRYFQSNSLLVDTDWDIFGHRLSLTLLASRGGPVTASLEPPGTIYCLGAREGWMRALNSATMMPRSGSFCTTTHREIFSKSTRDQIVFTIFRLIWNTSGRVRLCSKSVGVW